MFSEENALAIRWRFHTLMHILRMQKRAIAVGALKCIWLLALLVPVLGVGCGRGLSEDGVLKKVAPSMAIIRHRGVGIGSGFLVEGNFIVTAAHVTWPMSNVEVLFIDGTKHSNVPVVSYDHLADLAFIGPVDTSAPHLEFAEETHGKGPGSLTYAVGYARTLRKTANRGEVYSSWDWTSADISIVDTTAGATPGMSGGPLTNGKGEVIGVLTRGSEDGSSGPSSVTVQGRLKRVADGEEASAMGSRIPPDIGESRSEHGFVLRNRFDTAVFAMSSSMISIEFDSYRDVQYGLFDHFGFVGFNPPFRSTRDGITDKCCFYGSGLVVVRQLFDIERNVVLKSSVPLMRIEDPDDDRVLQIGQTITGVFDTPADIDWYTIRMQEGERIWVRLDFPSGHPKMKVTIDYPDAPPYDVLATEVGPEGVGYQARHDGEYTIVVETGGRGWWPGYILTIFSSPTASHRPDRPTDVLDSPVGEMLRHTFGEMDPVIQVAYPSDITGGDREVLAAELFEQDKWGRTVTLEKRDLSHHRQDPNEELTVGEYMERSVLTNVFPYKAEKTVTAGREIETPSGASVLIEDFETDDGGMKGVRLAYIHEDETGYMAIFYAPAEVFDKWRTVVDYCIGSFAIGDFSVADGM